MSTAAGLARDPAPRPAGLRPPRKTRRKITSSRDRPVMDALRRLCRIAVDDAAKNKTAKNRTGGQRG